MPRPIAAGLALGLLAAASFGTSGALVKPLLQAGWSPAAAVAVRVLIGGLVLLPIALVQLRGRWRTLWVGRWRILGMALVGVVGTQLFYFASLQTIPVGTAILIEYMAPLLLVLVAWVLSRRAPRPVVLIGSALAVAGLVLIVAPGGDGALDPVGVALAAGAMVGAAGYYVIAARPAHGLPSIALACVALLLSAALLGLVGLTGLLPMTASFADVEVLGTVAAWWVPLLLVGIISTAIAYASSISASAILGARLAAFMGLLEVAMASLWAFLLIGEQLTALQGLGGLLILGGIAFVRSDTSGDAEHADGIAGPAAPELDADDAAAGSAPTGDHVAHPRTSPVAIPAPARRRRSARLP
ncbi:EamA family transporter [Microcella flavibacter]|uniref:EamA family transporter n=1 Tax=Microcella flavibacter TaxID=1804990 RepID=UPI00145756C2|nr:DMT family transporter [Microcella flavibacter]